MVAIGCVIITMRLVFLYKRLKWRDAQLPQDITVVLDLFTDIGLRCTRLSIHGW